MSTKNSIALFLGCVLLCACAHTAPIDPKDLPPVNITDKEAHILSVGDIDGATAWPLRSACELSDGTYHDLLEDSLSKRNILVPDGTPARYTINATIDFITPATMEPWNDLTVKLQTHYHVFTVIDHKEVWTKDIASSNTTPALLNGSVWRNIW